MYYKNPLKNVICVLRDGLKQYRRYELNIGMVDNENRDDYFNPKKNRNMINIAGVYETEDFLLFFYGYKEKAYWMLCSKQDWMCKADNYEDCFTDDLSPSEEKFVCRSFTSVTQRHLISIREDKEGDANPTLLVAGIKIKNIVNLIKNEYEVSVFFFMLVLCFVGFSSKTCGH